MYSSPEVGFLQVRSLLFFFFCCLFLNPVQDHYLGNPLEFFSLNEVIGSESESWIPICPQCFTSIKAQMYPRPGGLACGWCWASQAFATCVSQGVPAQWTGVQSQLTQTSFMQFWEYQKVQRAVTTRKITATTTAFTNSKQNGLGRVPSCSKPN